MLSVAPPQFSDTAMWWKGRNTPGTDSAGASRGMSADCRSECTDKIPCPDTQDSTTARLSMEHTTARAPCTTKCSPNSIAFPGAPYAEHSDATTSLHTDQAGRPAARPHSHRRQNTIHPNKSAVTQIISRYRRMPACNVPHPRTTGHKCRFAQDRPSRSDDWVV